jgi:hypothetical protein
MTKYAVDTLTAYSILTLALSYTYQDYTTAPLPYRISYNYTYHLSKNVKTTDRPVSGMCPYPTFLWEVVKEFEVQCAVYGPKGSQKALLLVSVKDRMRMSWRM